MKRLIYLAYLLMIASAGVTFVFLEDIETQYNLPAWGIGLISSLAFSTAVVASLGIAPLGDKGFMVPLAIAGFATAIVGNLWIGFATELWSISVSRGLAGFGTGLFSIVGRKALIGDNTDDSGEQLGAFLSAAVVGFIAGPALGAQLANFGGIATPYVTIAVLLALIAIPTVRWLQAVPIAVTQEANVIQMIALLRSPAIRAAVAAHVAVFFNIGVFDATVDEYLTDLGVSNNGVGLILLVVAFPLVVIPRLAGRFVDSSPRPESFMLGAAVLFVPIILTLGFWTGVAVFVVFATIQTSIESTLFPSVARVVLNETGAERSAIGTGLVDAAGNLAAAFAAFVSPVVFDRAGGPSGSFGMSGAVATVLVIYTATQLRQRQIDSAALGPKRA